MLSIIQNKQREAKKHEARGRKPVPTLFDLKGHSGVNLIHGLTHRDTE